MATFQSVIIPSLAYFLREDHYYLDVLLDDIMSLFQSMDSGAVAIEEGMPVLFKKMKELRDLIYRHLQDEEDILCPIMLDDSFKEFF